MDKKACAYTPKWAHHIELRCFRILGSAHARDSTMAVIYVCKVKGTVVNDVSNIRRHSSRLHYESSLIVSLVYQTKH